MPTLDELRGDAEDLVKRAYDAGFAEGSRDYEYWKSTAEAAESALRTALRERDEARVALREARKGWHEIAQAWDDRARMVRARDRRRAKRVWNAAVKASRAAMYNLDCAGRLHNYLNAFDALKK